MTELTDTTQQPEVEFVNREFAEAEAQRAIELLTISDESKVEAWFALQAVADQVGPASNLCVRHIYWFKKGANRRGEYHLRARCVDGIVQTSTGAPGNLEEAKEPANLKKAQEVLARLIADKGGLTNDLFRNHGTSEALLAAVGASPEGREWIARRPSASQLLLAMLRVADVYGRDGVYAHASRQAHTAFIPFDDRADLVRQFPTGHKANAKAMSLRQGEDVPSASPMEVSRADITRLAVRAGVTPSEARVLLRAVMDGRSKAKLIRAVNEAVKMVEAGPDAKRLKVAA